MLLVKNVTQNPITLDDLYGYTFPANTTIDLEQYFSISQITSSKDFVSNVGLGNLVIEKYSSDLNLSSGNFINFSYFHDDCKDYLEIEESKYWNRIATFYYPGTSVITFKKFLVIAGGKKSGKNKHMRLYDYTNKNEICSLSFTNTSRSIYETSTLSNLPTNPAIFEIHAKMDYSKDKIYLYNVFIM